MLLSTPLPPDDALVNVAMQSLTETDLKLEDNLSKVVDTFKVRGAR